MWVEFFDFNLIIGKINKYVELFIFIVVNKGSGFFVVMFIFLFLIYDGKRLDN